MSSPDILPNEEESWSSLLGRDPLCNGTGCVVLVLCSARATARRTGGPYETIREIGANSKKTDEGWGKQLVPIHLPLLNTSRALRTHSTAYISLSTPPADPREDPPRLARRSFPTPCPPAPLSSFPPSPAHLQAHTTSPPLLEMPFTTNGTNGAGPAPAVVLEEPASVVDHSRVQHYIGESLIPPVRAEPGAGGGMEVVQQEWSY